MRTALRLTGFLDVAVLISALKALGGPGATLESTAADAMPDPGEPQGPAVAAWLAAAGPREHVLHLEAPEAVVRRLPGAYAALLAGRPLPPPEAGDVARYDLELAADHSRAAGLPARVAEARRAWLPGDRDTVLAAFLVLLGRYTGRERFVIGVAGEPLHADLSGDPTFDELVARIRGTEGTRGTESAQRRPTAFQVAFDGGATVLFGDDGAPDLALLAEDDETVLRYRAELFDETTIRPCTGTSPTSSPPRPAPGCRRCRCWTTPRPASSSGSGTTPPCRLCRSTACTSSSRPRRRALRRRWRSAAARTR